MKIACWQPTVCNAGEPGILAALRGVTRAAAAAGARLLVTPEMSLTGYHLDPRRLRELAEPADGPMCQQVRDIAAEHGIAIVTGWPEGTEGTVYNAAQLTDGAGDAKAVYRKAHLFGATDRSAFAASDNGVVQARLDDVTVGLLICYDVEFPEAVRAHALAGTQLLVVPTALMRPWEFVARTLVPARAFESQLFIAYSNWVGREGELGYCGLSRVVGPDGYIVKCLDDAEGLLLADIDLAAIDAARTQTTYLRDLRPELYPR